MFFLELLAKADVESAGGEKDDEDANEDKVTHNAISAPMLMT